MVCSISRERLSVRWGTVAAETLADIAHRVHLLSRDGNQAPPVGLGFMTRWRTRASWMLDAGERADAVAARAGSSRHGVQLRVPPAFLGRERLRSASLAVHFGGFEHSTQLTT